uniref:Transposase n=1 Tax=Panagrellus redivivus TaxID=6233 RepID=A0A7E4WD29_PANRE
MSGDLCEEEWIVIQFLELYNLHYDIKDNRHAKYTHTERQLYRKGLILLRESKYAATMRGNDEYPTQSTDSRRVGIRETHVFDGIVAFEFDFLVVSNNLQGVLCFEVTVDAICYRIYPKVGSKVVFIKFIKRRTKSRNLT